MRYTKKNLLPNEMLKYQASMHWIIYLPTLLSLIMALVLIKTGIAWIFVIIALYSLMRALLCKLGSEYMLTNKRIVFRQGIISRKTVEIILAKCEGVSVDQSIVGRILDYGTLVVSSGGVVSRFKYVKSPVTFRNQVNSEIDSFYRRDI